MISESGNVVQPERLRRVNTVKVKRKSDLWRKPREEGITRPPAKLSICLLLLCLVIKVTVCMFINQDPVLNQTVSLLAQSMRETEDELIRNMLASTSTVVNCTGGVNGDNPTELARSDIDTVILTLLSNDAMMISDNIEGTPKINTAPIREAFWGMMNTGVIDDLEAVTGFVSQAQYASYTNVLNAEWGSVSNIRFLYSSKGSTTPNASLNGNTIYNIFVTGEEAYAMIKLTQASASFIYTPPGGPTDPLRRLQLGAWKMAQVPRLMNDAWLINMRATHS